MIIRVENGIFVNYSIDNILKNQDNGCAYKLNFLISFI